MTGDSRSDTGPPSGAATAVIRLRLAPADGRYGNGLIAGSKVMEIFGDLETEIAIREAGDEGLCVGYDYVKFVLPLFVGDFVEGRASISSQGRTSRKVGLELYRVIAGHRDGTASPLDPPVLVAEAMATIVVGTNDRVAAAARGEQGSEQ